jgi:hypothetical protein
MIKPMLIGVGVLVVLGVAGLPVGNLLPFLILLACPLMMVFMMRGMDHGGAGHNEQHDHSHAGHGQQDEP